MKTYKLNINGEKYDTKVLEYSGTHAKVCVNGHEYYIQIEPDQTSLIPQLASQDKAVPLAPSFSSGVDINSGEVKAPIPGVISSIAVKEGDTVTKGQTLLVLEAMKMESEIAAPLDGKISKISVKERSPVQEGDILMIMEIANQAEKVIPASKRKPAQPVVDLSASISTDKIQRAPIPGVIVDVLVKPGDTVTEDSVLLILEAMKMESEIHSLKPGRILNVLAKKGDMVQEGDPLVELES